MGEARYLQIVEEIGERIDSGKLRPGERVPSTRQISREWGVAIATATKALATLSRQGRVQALPGVGTVVSSAVPLPQAPARAPRVREADPDLSQERIVRTAIGIADAEGLAAVSMRRLAADLGAATMSLYRHVEGKEDLVFLMMDACFGEEGLPAQPPPGWRAQLELSARLQWSLYNRHPWLAPVVSMTRPQLLPRGMAHTEWNLRALDGLGLSPNDRLHAVVTLVTFVRGIAVNLEMEVEAEQETGISDEQWMEAQEPTFARILASAPFPFFSQLVADPDLELDLGSLFEFGLEQMLDGLARRLQRAGGLSP